MQPTGGTECANLSTSMNITQKNDRSLAKAKEERIIKLGLDVHAGQITMFRQEEGLLPQPAQRMSWEKALMWIDSHITEGPDV